LEIEIVELLGVQVELRDEHVTFSTLNDDGHRSTTAPIQIESLMPHFNRLKDAFSWLAKKAEKIIGSPWAFLTALGLIFLWAVVGWLLGGAWHWPALVDTLTVLTFLMVLLLQNAQNRDARASQIKLNELIRVVEGTRLHLVDLERLTDEELERLEQAFLRMRERQGGGGQMVEQIAQEVERHRPTSEETRKAQDHQPDFRAG
jgi:low affinity Fe/Cu permease